MGIPSEAVCIGHVGRFNEQKNHTFLIDIFKEINQLNPNTFLLLIGSGPLEQSIKDKVRNENISNILFLGGRDDINILMSNIFDIFLFPSLYEGLGIVLLEAQASNLQCLISDTIPQEVTIIKENIKYLSLRESPEKWAETLLNILNNRSELDLLSLKQRIGNSHFSIESSVESLEDIYS